VRILAATLKFPLKLLIQLAGSKRNRIQKTKLEQKQLKYIQNFDPSRLNNRS